ncbi:unnamed protein product [Camellia sinensis]
MHISLALISGDNRSLDQIPIACKDAVAILFMFDLTSRCTLNRKGIDENWAAALEHNPEAFARVVMLYVDMEVNGVPLKVVTREIAWRSLIVVLSQQSYLKAALSTVGLLRLMDQRYKGIAYGVGQSEILGRIHVAPIKVGNVFYP